MAGKIKIQMTIANIIKFLEPTTLELRIAFSGLATGALSALAFQNSSLLWAIPLSVATQIYPLFRITEYKLRNEKLDNPNRPKKIISEYLADIDFSPERDYP